ncbi:MAG: hypothetical protein M1831_004512 [Alyxoria varia]|nr:MAG: hypothetical protein M1831_004512 [Alyxoria varia]
MPLRNWFSRRRRRSSSPETELRPDGVSSLGRPSGSNLSSKRALPFYLLLALVYIIWGFSLGLAEVLNSKFEKKYRISSLKSSFLQTALYAPFAFAPITFGAKLTQRVGYRRAVAIGLGVFALGETVLFLSSFLEVFPLFYLAYFITGIGFSFLECSISPFVAGCGPSRWAELRLTAAMGLSSLSQVAAIFLAGQFLGLDDERPKPMVDPLALVYAGMTCFTLLLAFIIYISSMPETIEEDAVLSLGIPGGSLRRERSFMLAVASLFFYFGSQIVVSVFLIGFLTQAMGLTEDSAAGYLAMANLVFAVGRLIFAALMRFVRPSYMLFASAFISTALFTLAIFLPRDDRGIPLSLLLAFFFAKAAISPATYALALRGLGSNTKRGGGVLTAAHCGGALAPVFGSVADRKSFATGFYVPLGGMVLSMAFPVAVNTVYRRKYRELEDEGRGETVTSAASRSYFDSLSANPEMRQGRADPVDL